MFSSRFSDVQGKELQLQLDQITAKEDTTFNNKLESPRPSKARVARTKSRRSPYPHITHPEYGAEYPEKPYNHEYSSEMALQVQTAGYPGLVYASQEAVAERYGAFYPTAAAYGAHAGLYGGESSMAGMYAPYSHHRYFDDRSPYARSHYPDDKYSSSYTSTGGARESAGSHATSGYLGTGSMHGTPGLDSPRVPTSTESRPADSYSRQTDPTVNTTSSALTGGAGQYSDCVTSSGGAGGQCSRSSSREAGYSNSSMGQHYPMSYSNPRSESSASDVDVTDGDYHSDVSKRHKRLVTSRCAVDPRHNGGSGTGSGGGKYDSVVLETSRLSEESKRYKDSCSRTSTNNNDGLTNGSGDVSTSKDSVIIQQSVIMRRQPALTTGSSGSGGGSNSLVDLSSSRSHQEEHLKLSTSAAVISDIHHRKSVVETSHTTDSLYGNSHCAYDSYKQSPSYHNGGFHTGRSHPMMPQPGYTSVIVDAQQYHMANGYVH